MRISHCVLKLGMLSNVYTQPLDITPNSRYRKLFACSDFFVVILLTSFNNLDVPPEFAMSTT